MEVELNFIEELLEKESQKIEDFKVCEPSANVCESLEEELAKMKADYERICKMFINGEEYEEFAMSRLHLILKNCKFLKQDMESVLPSWIIPQEPILSEEDTRDFIHYSEWIYAYIGYLASLKAFRPEIMTRQFDNRLYGLKRELSEVFKLYRFNYTTGRVWDMSIRLRERMYDFGIRSSDIIERYLKEKENAAELPVHV